MPTFTAHNGTVFEWDDDKLNIKALGRITNIWITIPKADLEEFVKRCVDVQVHPDCTDVTLY